MNHSHLGGDEDQNGIEVGGKLKQGEELTAMQIRQNRQNRYKAQEQHAKVNQQRTEGAMRNKAGEGTSYISKGVLQEAMKAGDETSDPHAENKLLQKKKAA